VCPFLFAAVAAAAVFFYCKWVFLVRNWQYYGRLLAVMQFNYLTRRKNLVQYLKNSGSVGEGLCVFPQKPQRATTEGSPLHFPSYFVKEHYLVPTDIIQDFESDGLNRW
jgi:hypothetical protein